jgi:hypothetical protein
MNSSIAWATFPLVAVALGWVGHHFSLRVLRLVALFTAAATVVYITRYGLTHPAPSARTHPVQGGGSLLDAFARGADAVSVALFHAAPSQTGWIVLAAGLVIGYRQLEAWTLHGQARSLDTSALSADQADSKPDNESGDGKGAGQDKRTDAVSGKQDYDRLTAELKFRLPAVEVRAPAIFPGGSRAGGLASIAEASGLAAGGLAGAIINFFGMLWPSPRRLRVRVWMERTPGNTGIDDITRVTVHLDDPRTGESIATKTLAACGVDNAASVVAGYVARHIFAGDRTAPPWCTGATDGRDLAALLLARQVRNYPESEEKVCRARHKQIAILEGVTRSPQCAGVTRYELGQLYDLTNRHVEALLKHAVNRAQYPLFYRGRYRLAMSLEMIANAHSGVPIRNEDVEKFNLILEILWKCGVLEGDRPCLEQPRSGDAELPRDLRERLLKAAWEELLAIRRYLWLPTVLWRSFWHRDERAILRPYWRLPYRQAFRDGVCAALLLVAVRRADFGPDCVPPRPRRAWTILRVATAITGDGTALARALGISSGLEGLERRLLPVTKTLRTRRWFRRYRSRSWQAGYNLACAYAAVMQTRLASKAKRETGELHTLTEQIVACLEFAVCNPECEIERPGDWIGNDPDFSFLHCRRKDEQDDAWQDYQKFRKFLETQKLRDYPSVPLPREFWEEGQICDMSSIAPAMGPAR